MLFYSCSLTERALQGSLIYIVRPAFDFLLMGIILSQAFTWQRGGAKHDSWWIRCLVVSSPFPLASFQASTPECMLIPSLLDPQYFLVICSACECIISLDSTVTLVATAKREDLLELEGKQIFRGAIFSQITAIPIEVSPEPSCSTECIK